MLEDFLLEKYAPYGIRKANEIYLPFSTSSMFVGECSSLKIAILGLDFVHFKPGMTIPVVPINSLENSPILNEHQEWDDIVKECNKEALNVLHIEEERDPTQYYNPTLYEKSEWQDYVKARSEPSKRRAESES